MYEGVSPCPAPCSLQADTLTVLAVAGPFTTLDTTSTGESVLSHSIQLTCLLQNLCKICWK